MASPSSDVQLRRGLCAGLICWKKKLVAPRLITPKSSTPSVTLGLTRSSSRTSRRMPASQTAPRASWGKLST
jgi:hypothetical protein